MPDKDYSHRDVTDKLSLEQGFVVRVVGKGAPDLLARARQKTGRGLARSAKTPADVILYWPKSSSEITPTLIELRQAITPNGGIWVITAKRNCTSAGGMAYFNQDALIPLGAAAGLVDNKICSLSDSESAMRFVIRKKDRT
ncbi:MAG: DUF3052 family protein [Chloroflexi bacterium]|nr:DUF3052 family protein [Chloroflexota bacterium]